MLAYAAARRPEGRANSPTALVLILAGHALVIGGVIMAKTDIGTRFPFVPTVVTLIPEPVPPPPDPQPQPKARPSKAARSTIDQVPPLVPTIPRDATPFDPGPLVVDPGVKAGTADPVPLPTVTLAPVRKAARFMTAPDDVRPPYPESKRQHEEEASLRLAIEIDARGRVTSVEPVGKADPAFLEAARRHILRRWRYAPATEGGSAVASRTVITLKFELER